MTVLDIGAHCGYFTLLSAHIVGPTGLVIAFEPNPASYEIRIENVWAHRLRNVIAFPWAATDRGRMVQLHLSESNSGDHRVHVAEEDRGALAVRATSIDAIGPLPRSPDFIKIDTQGAEAEVLDGMAETLAHAPNATLTLEFWPLPGTRRAFRDALIASGFHLTELKPDGNGPEPFNADDILEENPSDRPDRHMNLILTRAG